MRIQSYQDLRVWQEAMSLAEQVYRLSQSLPPEERYGMCSQMRRAAISVPANIAEGWARGTTQQFLQFLSIAAGSLRELETYLILAQRVELLPPPSVLLILQHLEQVSRQLLALRRSLQK